MTASELLYLFLALLGLFIIIVVIIMHGLKEKPKKASIEFRHIKKGMTTKIHFTNVSKEKEKEILRDIQFDLMQIESKIKNQFNILDAVNNVIKWKEK